VRAAVVLGALTVVFPLLFSLNMLVSAFSRDFLHSLLGVSFTESLLLCLVSTDLCVTTTTIIIIIITVIIHCFY